MLVGSTLHGFFQNVHAYWAMEVRVNSDCFRILRPLALLNVLFLASCLPKCAKSKDFSLDKLSLMKSVTLYLVSLSVLVHYPFFKEWTAHAVL